MSDERVVLVTGGAGFIGSHLVDRLLALGHRVRVVDNLSTGNLTNLAHVRDRIDLIIGDLCDAAVSARAVQDAGVVMHVAALPSVPRSLQDVWGSHDANVNATVRLLQACREVGVRRVVYSSSSSVYGDTPELPKRESMRMSPRSPYAAAKLASEQYVLAFARAGLLEGVALRYFNVFGPRQSPHSAYAAVIPLFLSSALHGQPAVVHGDGLQTRDFTYVENVVQANVLAATAPAENVSGEVFNVGSGARISLRELLALMRTATGCDLRASYGPPRGGDVRDSLASLEAIGAALGYAPTVGLVEGLSRTWEALCAAETPSSPAPSGAVSDGQSVLATLAGDLRVSARSR